MDRISRIAAGLAVAATVGVAVAELGFEDRVVYPVAGGPFRVTVADVDGVNGPDIICPAWFGEQTQVLYNDGTGRYGAAVDFPAGAGPTHVAAGLVNDDEFVDLVVTGAPTLLLLNDGTGGFTADALSVSGGFNSVLAELDGEPGLDLATIETPSGVRVLLNNGTGGLNAGGSFPAVGPGGEPSPSWISAADMDGDGDQDIVVTASNGSNSELRVYRNDGAANFTHFSTTVTISGAFTFDLADFDGDGSTDVVTGTLGDTTYAAVHLNDGDGNLPTQRDLVGGPIVAEVIAVDLDGDQDIDIAVAEGVPIVSYHLNDGSGFFGPAVPRDSGSTNATQGLAAGDLDRDGRVDLVAANWTANSVGVLLRSEQPAPSATAVTPGVVTGTEPVTLEISGTGFEPGSTVDLGNGIVVDQVTYNSESSLTARIQVQFPFGSAMRDVVVVNLDGQVTRAVDAVEFRSVELAVTRGDIKDVSRSGRDKLKLSGTALLNDLRSPIVVFDARASAYRFRVGNDADAVVVEIPENAPGWKTNKRGRLTWKSARGASPKVKLRLDPRTGAFQLTASKLEYAFTPTTDVTVEYETEQGGMIDRNQETRTWQAPKVGKLKLR